MVKICLPCSMKAPVRFPKFRQLMNLCFIFVVSTLTPSGGRSHDLDAFGNYIISNQRLHFFKISIFQLFLLKFINFIFYFKWDPGTEGCGSMLICACYGPYVQKYTVPLLYSLESDIMERNPFTPQNLQNYSSVVEVNFRFF